jgi:hypothetical protein
MNMPVSPNSLDPQESRARDSLFLLADLTIEDSGERHKVKVRNLSSGGMMVEADIEVVQGQRIVVDLRNIGPVRGQIAWARAERFGVAFDRQINPKLARKPVGSTIETPRYLRTPITHNPSFPR